MEKQVNETSSNQTPSDYEDQDVAVGREYMSIEDQHKAIDQLAVQHGVNHRRLMAKLDMWIVPPICLLYLLAFLDRVNISNAQVYGMGDDIGLTGNQYNVALTIFFVPYVVAEVPSNYLLKKFRPHLWLSLCMVIFGAVMIGQGFVKNYSGILATRFFLGMFEAGMFPGCFYLLSMWYRRDEAQKRYSFFFSSTCLAGAFGGLIAYGCNQIDGAKGLAGWRWLYIIEGAITMFCSIVLFFFIADFPEDAKFLKENERQFLKAKLEFDVGASGAEIPLDLKGVGRVFKEWKIYMAGLMYFCLIIPAYGYAYFSTAIIKEMKYSPVQTQLHSVPPWAASFGMSMLFAVVADRLRHRFTFAVLSSLICAAGFIMLLANHTNIHVRYGGCFLVACGAYTSMPLIVCWTNLNFSGHHRRSVGTAFQVGFGNIGGIIATFAFLSKDAPYYTKGIGLGLAFALLCVVITTAYFLGVVRENRLKDKGLWTKKWNKMSPEVQAVSGDLDPNFRYTY